VSLAHSNACVSLFGQVCSTSFYLKTLPLFDGGDDVGMVLSPQCFHNLNMHADIFNHSNVHFWE
jgi:endoglucanase